MLHILLALAAGTTDDAQGKHGYALAQEIESLTGGAIRMGPGTLYGSIQRMLATELIEEVPRGRGGRGRAPGAAEDDGDERRRYYRATALGRDALDLELRRLARVVNFARRKHLLRDPEPA
ncbi:MAG TPA: helix-turn-helix transcriptional regulator [Gemmatimonadaceae bacterium]|nr:helix-turn-helix transcriptional regulator [Gemmatimonadaceae bacterium]